MSGVVGCYCRGGRSAAETVRTMSSRIDHRGPHGDGAWADGVVGLGYRLRRTTPEADAYAIPDSERGVAIVADVRLDNRTELVEALSLDGAVADVELLRAAYDRWGTNCPERLLGAFAFAVWDARERRLFCARDHMGVKPLYYHASDDRVAFGSELGTLLPLPGVSRRPDDRRIGEYLLGWFDDERRTFYRDVNRLPPAHTLTVSDGAVRTERYWRLDPARELSLDSDAAYERRFRDLFVDAVRCRLRSNGPVGAFLSGGVDSSSITCVADDLLKRTGDGPLHTFSAVFDAVPDCDEREYIDVVHDWTSNACVPHAIDGDETSPLFDVDRQLAHRNEPFYPSLFMLIWRLLHAAAERNVRVVLNGYGGDQTVGSDTRAYPRDLALRGKFADLAAELRALHDRYDTTYRGLLWREVLKPLLPGAVRRLWHRQTDPERFVTNGIASIDPAFARRTNLVERSYRDATTPPPRTHRDRHYRNLTRGEPTFNLELTDGAAAAVGVEVRYPYLDRRLVEFALALPPERNVQGGVGRIVLRRALDDLVPPSVRWRTDKTEFSSNVVHTLRTHELDRVEDVLFDDAPLAGAYLDRGALRDSFDRFRAEGHVDDARNLLMATTLELWLRRHTDRGGATP